MGAKAVFQGGGVGCTQFYILLHLMDLSVDDFLQLPSNLIASDTSVSLNLVMLPLQSKSKLLCGVSPE